MSLLLLAAAFSLLALLAVGATVLVDRASGQRGRLDRAAIAAHWESLVMRRRDLRLAVDAVGVPTLHGRAGSLAYTIAVTAPDGPWGGRPLAQTTALAGTTRLALCRKGELAVPVPGMPAAVSTGDEDFDAVFEVRCDDPEAARARLGQAVRAAMLAIPGAFAWVDAGGLRVDLGASATAIDDALLDALREVLVGIGGAVPPAVAAG